MSPTRRDTHHEVDETYGTYPSEPQMEDFTSDYVDDVPAQEVCRQEIIETEEIREERHSEEERRQVHRPKGTHKRHKYNLRNREYVSE